MEFIKSPLNYTGGKFKLLPKIMPLFYEAETFIDLFGGVAMLELILIVKKLLLTIEKRL